MPQTAPQPSTAPAVRPDTGQGRAKAFLSRLGQALITLWVTVTLLFFAQIILPGDRATIYLNVYEGQSVERTPEELAPINREFGFDRPLLVQYADYLQGVLRGDLGIALQSRRPVTEMIGEQIGATAQLTAVAIVLAWLITLAWTLATAGRSRRVSRFGAAAEALVAGMPHYWLGLLLLLFFAVRLDWFPVVGGSALAGLWLPALTLALPLAGFLGQATRAEYERTLQQPHVLSSRARGTADLRVRVVHALRPALIPGITLSGWALGALVSGAVIVENVFSRPGIGALLVSAVELKEFELISGIILIVSLVYVLLTFVTDWLYTVVDPRVRLSYEGAH
ncbi:ABC transporter permease [Corticibacter populi]|uniref:ABC transporter permease n=1 Tax=Corticibacter populi TaxID=1550736 RepID=A0A3M6QXH6_9BURK|nr:ABC transporter permease [Corticibacter populi]RMX07730.1 ABC transporter permease [Corticibacter populi]RZS30246.1 peptide/nickel transport system permease protein [Corticibacter populi]